MTRKEIVGDFCKSMQHMNKGNWHEIDFNKWIYYDKNTQKHYIIIVDVGGVIYKFLESVDWREE